MTDGAAVETSLRQRMAVGAGWMIALRFADRLVGLVSIIILARLLVPEDFGLVSLANAVIAIVGSVGEFSVDMVLIRDQAAGRKEYDTAWTLNVLNGLGLTLALIGLAAPASAFYGEPRVEPVLYWLSLSVALSSVQNIGVVDFRKHFRFHKEFAFVIVPRLVGVVVTIILAFLWHDYWALVGGTIVGRAASTMASYAMHPYRPRPSLAGFGTIFHFSKWMLLNSVLAALAQRVDQFVLGRISGAAFLGQFALASEISGLTATALVAPIVRAVYPAYAKLAADPDRLKSSFLKVHGIVWLTAMPVAAGIAVLANLYVPLLLGSKWITIIPLIEILTLYAIMRVTVTGMQPVFLSLNKPHLTTATQGLYVFLLIPGVVLGAASADALGAAWGVVIAAIAVRSIQFRLIKKLLHITWLEMLAHTWRPLAGAVAMWIAVRALESMWSVDSDRTALLMKLIACIALGAIVYTATVLGLWAFKGHPSAGETDIVKVGRSALRWIGEHLRSRRL